MTDFEIVELGNQYLLDKQRQQHEAQVQATEAMVQNLAQLLLPIPLEDQHLPYTTPSWIRTNLISLQPSLKSHLKPDIIVMGLHLQP